MFVNLSVPWRRGPDHLTASPRQSLQSKAAGQLSIRGIPLPLDGLFFMRFTWRCCSPLPWGQSPWSCWPLCLFAAALIHRCLLPAEQQVCDLLTRLFVGRVSLVTTVIGSSYPLSLTTFRSLIGQACQGGDRARDYGMRYGPGERGSLSTETSQLIENPVEIFKKIENSFFVDPSSESTVWTFLFGFLLSGCLTLPFTVGSRYKSLQ